MDLKDMESLKCINISEYLNLKMHSFIPNKSKFDREVIAFLFSHTLDNLFCCADEWNESGYHIWKQDGEIYCKDHPNIINIDYNDFQHIDTLRKEYKDYFELIEKQSLFAQERISYAKTCNKLIAVGDQQK